MKVSVNYEWRGKMPANMTPEQSRAWWRKFNGDFVNQDLETADLIAAIQQGHAYTTWHDRYRKRDNFVLGAHVALDFDTDDERSSFDHLLQDDFIRQYASFLHTTPSHTPEKPRARVVFELDRPITNADKYTLLSESLVHRYSVSDSSCKDPARLFFGAQGCEIHNLGNVLSLEDAARELVKPYQAYLDAERKEAEDRLRAGVVLSKDDLPDSTLTAHRDALLEKVQYAVDGEKYRTLRNVAITMGGYVAGGYYTLSEAKTWLQDAIDKNGNNVQDKRAAYACIADSLSYGQARPLQFEARIEDEPDLERELETVDPPLTDVQKAQVKAIYDKTVDAIVEKRINQFFKQLNGHRDLWETLVPSSAVSGYRLGYRDEGVDTDTGEILAPALTVPYFNIDGYALNIEYRHTEGGGIEYETTTDAQLYIADRFSTDWTGPALLLDDAVDAIWYMTNRGGYELAAAGRKAPHVLGTPKMPLSEATFSIVADCEPIYIVVGKDTHLKRRDLDPIASRARVLRVDGDVSAFMNTLSAKEFDWYLRQAKKI